MAVVCGKCRSTFPQETAMIRSRTVNTIHELSAQGKSIQDIAITLGLARNTVRKYLRHPELSSMPHPRPNRRSKLDPFKEQIKQWIKEDHCYNCESMLPRLLAMGYTGSLSVLKAFVHPLRPPAGGHYPVVRYETKPGKQVQFDWGEFKYEREGIPRKLYGFTAILCYSRLRFVSVVKQSFWAGVTFTDVDDLNRQAHAWCERINARVHRTTHERPRERREREPLSPLPAAFAWERFATEERKVSWDGYLSYDGVLYGLPSEPPVAGSVVQVRERHGMLKVWSHGQLLVELAKRAGSGEHVEHPDQFRNVAPAASRRAQLVPLGHHRPAPQVMTRALAEYDQVCGLGASMEVHSCNLN